MPKELAAEVDALVDSRKHGYRSRGEFVSDAVRRRLDELKRKV
jgi:metal-responsive CopG/Arc/MetJ family transcriptional regulator